MIHRPGLGSARLILPAVGLLTCGLAATVVEAQTPPATRPVESAFSPDVHGDRTVTFRLRVLKATSVRLVGGDLPGNGGGTELTKGEDGVWSATFGPVPGGAYRYHFAVDHQDFNGLEVADPANPLTSQSNGTVWSLANVPGDARSDRADVPHGAVAEVFYRSTSLGQDRRMHVYTPPGYEAGTDRYPVLYLLHGASDSDDSWTTVGRANWIVDNAIAAGTAVPMIVVMPNGHAGPTPFVRAERGSLEREIDGLTTDLLNDIQPLIDARYRTVADRDHRAVAGLSMGGGQTIQLAVTAPERFAYYGVFSSGVFGITGDPRFSTTGPTWAERHKEVLAGDKLKQGVKLFWMAIGKEDFLLDTHRATVALFEKHGLPIEVQETARGHVWLEWRDYLAEFVPRLFQPGPSEK